MIRAAALRKAMAPPLFQSSPAVMASNPHSVLSIIHFHQYRLRAGSPVAALSSVAAALSPVARSELAAEKDFFSMENGRTFSSTALVVVSFYKFADLTDFVEMRQPLKELCQKLRVSGGIILAPEGINGSICGTPEAVHNVLESIQADKRLANLRHTESPAGPEDESIHHGHTEKSPLGAGEDAPFRWNHVRVKLKNEVVPLGVPSVSPAKIVGKYVKPKDWNSLVQKPGTVVVDVRNTYEIRIGKFKGAVNPQTTSFREFPLWVEHHLLTQESKQNRVSSPCHLEISPSAAGSSVADFITPPCYPPRRVAMYCTGGIRCEKATSFLMSKGFKEVYHLEGGILKYLEEIPLTESLWEGECFVFDKRVSVGHGLKQGTYQLCYACKKPISDEDMKSPEWEEGVSCPYCFFTKSHEEKERARARQVQFELWGMIGGIGKGRRPVFRGDNTLLGQ